MCQRVRELQGRRRCDKRENATESDFFSCFSFLIHPSRSFYDVSPLHLSSHVRAPLAEFPPWSFYCLRVCVLQLTLAGRREERDGKGENKETATSCAAMLLRTSSRGENRGKAIPCSRCLFFPSALCSQSTAPSCLWFTSSLFLFSPVHLLGGRSEGCRSLLFLVLRSLFSLALSCISLPFFVCLFILSLGGSLINLVDSIFFLFCFKLPLPPLYLSFPLFLFFVCGPLSFLIIS